jgi:hypothetical protein
MFIDHRAKKICRGKTTNEFYANPKKGRTAASKIGFDTAIRFHV